MTEKEKTARLAYLKGQMQLCEMRFGMWLVKSAMSGAAREECLKVAQRHMELYEECLNNQDELLRM